MSTSYEERLNIGIGAVKGMIRKIRKILEAVAKHENIYIPKNFKDKIARNTSELTIKKRFLVSH